MKLNQQEFEHQQIERFKNRMENELSHPTLKGRRTFKGRHSMV